MSQPVSRDMTVAVFVTRPGSGTDAPAGDPDTGGQMGDPGAGGILSGLDAIGAVGGMNADGVPDGSGADESGANGAASGSEPRVLLHEHARLGRWLPPGGHIEPNELPDEAALREVLEETGLTVELIGEQVDIPSLPGDARQLTRPAGVQVVAIAPGHEHIDLVYLARAARDAEPTTGRWLSRTELDDPSLGLTAEVKAWCEHVLARHEDET